MIGNALPVELGNAIAPNAMRFASNLQRYAERNHFFVAVLPPHTVQPSLRGFGMVGLAERFQISLVLFANMDERKVLGKYVVLELCPLIPAQAENIIRFELNFVGVLFVLAGEQSL